DRWVCNISGDGKFSIKDIRNAIDDLFLPSWTEPTRWVKSIPIKINIFAWRARRDCLPTRVNLIRRGRSEKYLSVVGLRLATLVFFFRVEFVAWLDFFGEHAVHCKELSGFKYRHDMVRGVLFDVCRRAGISAKKEAHVNFLNDPLDGRYTLRPTDILILNGLEGNMSVSI
nr:RNA-directed DNA polymerase, eukaryota [Tanacetum cinerariifolium]